MSRLLYFLICIDLCFCNNFIDNYSKYVKKHLGNGKTNRERTREGRIVFDVAEFMKTEKSLDSDSNVVENRDEDIGHIQSNFDYTGLINDITGNVAENAYLNAKDSEMDKNLKDLLSLEDNDEDNDSELLEKDGDSGHKNKVLYEANLLKNPEKKCVFKKMKIPFFSHSTSTTKSRKTKKKNSECINFNKKEKTERLNTYERSSLEKPKRLSTFKHHKDLFKKFLGHKKAKEKVIHNCRQFYQNKAQIAVNSGTPNVLTRTTKQFTTQKDKVNIDYNGEIIEDNDNSESSSRLKRYEIDDRDRRLKILEAIEKKVDNTEIASPVLTTPSTPTSTDITE